ncbi:MAG: PQQ-binding-like beta-propeller repeat protein [Chloroflexota bacterium]
MTATALWALGFGLYLLPGTTEPEPAPVADWPAFRGAVREGTGSAPTLPAEFGVEDYNWRVPLPGPGHSSPVIGGGRVMLTSVVPATEGAGEKRAVYALEIEDGSLAWRN